MPDLLALAKARQLAKTGAGRLIRLNYNLSLRNVAEEITVSPTTVLRWERQERCPRGEAAERWARLIEQLSREGLHGNR